MNICFLGIISKISDIVRIIDQRQKIMYNSRIIAAVFDLEGGA